MIDWQAFFICLQKLYFIFMTRVDFLKKVWYNTLENCFLQKKEVYSNE